MFAVLVFAITSFCVGITFGDWYVAITLMCAFCWGVAAVYTIRVAILGYKMISQTITPKIAGKKIGLSLAAIGAGAIIGTIAMKFL